MAVWVDSNGISHYSTTKKIPRHDQDESIPVKEHRLEAIARVMVAVHKYRCVVDWHCSGCNLFTHQSMVCDAKDKLRKVIYYELGMASKTHNQTISKLKQENKELQAELNAQVDRLEVTMDEYNNPMMVVTPVEHRFRHPSTYANGVEAQYAENSILRKQVRSLQDSFDASVDEINDLKKQIQNDGKFSDSLVRDINVLRGEKDELQKEIKKMSLATLLACSKWLASMEEQSKKIEELKKGHQVHRTVIDNMKAEMIKAEKSKLVVQNSLEKRLKCAVELLEDGPWDSQLFKYLKTGK